MKVAVLIPCYNEEVTIKKVVEDFKRELPEANIYVYDNNSKDRTVELAKAAGAHIGYETRQGKGHVVSTMFKEVDADCYIMADGDDTYPANEVHKLIKEVENGADMVVGDRLSSTYYKENKRPFHNVGNWMVKFLLNLLFHGEIKDAMSGYRAFSKRFVKTFPAQSPGFQIETEMTAWSLSHGMDIRNVVVEYKDRPEGSYSKLSTVKDGMRVLFMIFKLKIEYGKEKTK